MGELIQSEIKLSIGILVSNQKKYIRKAMESVQSILKAIPSELIALDTKGAETDGSIDIVREYTDKIYPFVWCNDFAAARNELLAHANGEWFLFFDDDEVFDDVQELINFFLSGECEKYQSANYYTKNYDKTGEFTMSVAGRMVRRRTDTCFVGKVHENFRERLKPIKQFSFFVHHYGYVYETEEDKKKKQERNVSLLKEEISLHGETLAARAQLVQELLAVGDTVEAGLTYIEESLAILGEQGLLQDAMSQWMIIVGVRALRSQNRFEEALEYAKHVQETYEFTNASKMALAAEMMIAAAVLGKLDVMTEALSVYLCEWNWGVEHKKELEEQTSMDFPRYQTEEYHATLLSIAATRYNLAERFEEAYECWKKIIWGSPEIDAFSYKDELLKTVTKLKDPTPYREYCSHFYQEQYFTPEMDLYLPYRARIKQEKKRVGIFTKVYRAEETMHKAIQSVLEQSYRNIRYYVLVSEATAPIVEEYAKRDDRICVIYGKPGENFSHYAKQVAADGNAFVATADADDYCHPDYIKNMLYFAEEHHLDLVACGCYIMDESRRIVNFRAWPKANLICTRKQYVGYFRNSYVYFRTIWGKLFSSELLMKADIDRAPSFDSCGGYGWDTMFLFNLLYDVKYMGIMQDVLYYYQYAFSGDTFRLKPGRIEADTMCFEFVRDLLLSMDAYSKENRRFLYQVYSCAINDTMKLLWNQKDQEIWEKGLRQIYSHPCTREMYQIIFGTEQLPPMEEFPLVIKEFCKTLS